MADRLATAHDFRPLAVPADRFVLQAFIKGRPGLADSMAVYIEGDGHAWADRYRLSSDPTPRDPRALRLAVQDPGPNVVYLARPCQYTIESAPAGCHARYWSYARMAPEVVRATGAAIDYLKAALAVSRVRLIGYSGGGGLAVLVSAGRDDVTQVTTVAGNLDHAAWTRHHDITPLDESLNPVDYADRTAHIRQVHLIGQDDDVMPALVAQSYATRLADQSNARFAVIPDYDHDCCWARTWPQLLRQYQIASDPAAATN